MIAAQVLLPKNVMTDVYYANPRDGLEVWADVFICNQDGAQWTTLDVVLVRSVAEETTEQYIYRGYSMQPSQTKHPKLLLREGESIRVRATTAKVSVTVMTEEVATANTIERLAERVDEVTLAVHELKEALTTTEVV